MNSKLRWLKPGALHVQGLFKDSDYSDLTIKCNEKTWKVHRAIVCKRCPFFQAACGGSFWEAATQEIDLSTDDSDALEVMLLFLYTKELPQLRAIHYIPIVATCVLAVTADKYGILALRDHATARLIRFIKGVLARGIVSNPKNAVQWFTLMREIWCCELDCFEALKTLVMEELAQVAGKLTENGDLQELLEDRQDFTLALIKAVDRKVESGAK